MTAEDVVDSPANSMASSGDQSNSQGNTISSGVAVKTNEAALLHLMERTGYSIVQENGQRKYGGPPPAWEGPSPPKGCEVFVGKIPRDLFEDELVPVFEQIGQIYELRLMMDFSGNNRGYAFVMYTTKGDAQNAVRQLNNYEIRKGRFLGVCPSVDNCRLFVGGIPKSKTREEILCEMKKVTEGVVAVIVYPSAIDKSKNRGFAFVEYESHRAAAMARRKLIPGKIQLWGHEIAVDWAEPEREVDEETMSKVKILYVRNLMLNTTEEQIKQIFNGLKDNSVERVKKIRDYAFVHFIGREDALNAMNAMNGKELDSSKIEVTLAKPADKSTFLRYGRNSGRVGYPNQAQPYSNYQQQYSQIIEPTYQNATYYQYPAPAARGRGRGAAGMRGVGGRGYLQYSMRGNRRLPTEVRLYDILPGMELTPVHPFPYKPQLTKSTVQMLEELCQKNGWSSPMFVLHQTPTRDGSGDDRFYMFKVTIHMPAGQPLQFTPNKVCKTIDEAKVYSAEHVLSQLAPNLNIEGNEISQTSTLSVSTVPNSHFQGRPIASGYSMTNGGTAVDMSYTSTMPVTNHSYMVTPGKIITSHGEISAYYDPNAGYAPPGNFEGHY